MQAPARKPHHARFGPFEVDLQSGELRSNGRRIRLQEKPFQVLSLLLERPGEVVTREEIQRRLWPTDTFVDFEHGINVAVQKLREALDDDAVKPRFIETLPRHGYRFIAPVESVPPAYDRRQEPAPAEDREERPAVIDRRYSERAPRRRWVIALAACAAVVTLAVLAGLRDRIATLAGSRQKLPLVKIDSIAVLPLENLSGDQEQEYFADGLTDALITDLGKAVTLRVISRTSVMRYKRTKKSLPEIARELNVDAVVEGTVQHSGNRVRITAQLIEARHDRHLWSETYERDATELVRLEEQVALAIAHEVTGQLTPAQEIRLPANKTTNPRAYDAYLRGRYLWNQRTEEPVAQAVGYFEQALREDRNFALAYSGLADCYSVGWWSKGNLPMAEELARKALALEPDLAEGHASLGIAEQYQLKFLPAERELKRAIELNTNYASAHHFYAIHLLSVGRLVEALAENGRALQLDPFSLPVNTVRGYILIGQRQYEQASKLCEATAAMDPQIPYAHWVLARIYWINGRVPEALAEERKAAALTQQPARLHAAEEIAEAYRQSGLRAAQKKLAQLREKGTIGEGTPLDIAYAFGLLADKEKLMEWLNRSFRERNDDLLFVLKSAPEFDCVRSEPRFQDLLRRAGLPD